MRKAAGRARRFVPASGRRRQPGSRRSTATAKTIRPTFQNCGSCARAAPPASPLLVTGYRRIRQDSWSKRAASRIANRIRRRLLGDDTPDTGCGLKLFSRALFLDLPDFDHMHRFLPALVLRAGGNVRSVPVNHRRRRGGVSKYGVFDRLGVGIVDLFGVMWLQRRATRPHLLVEPSPDEPAAASSPAVPVLR